MSNQHRFDGPSKIVEAETAREALEQSVCKVGDIAECVKIRTVANSGYWPRGFNGTWTTFSTFETILIDAKPRRLIDVASKTMRNCPITLDTIIQIIERAGEMSLTGRINHYLNRMDEIWEELNSGRS